MKTNNNLRLLSVNRVAEIFGVKATTIREWAKSGEITGMKIGKKWYFNQNHIFGLQGEQDARKFLGESASKSSDNSYDLLYNNQKIEVKSSGLKYSKPRGNYWYFSHYRKTKSDFYILLGYDKDRKNLLSVFLIPTDKLEAYLSENVVSKNMIGEPHFVVTFNNEFFNIYKLKNERK